MSEFKVYSDTKLRLLDLASFRKILSIQPHPDDTDIAIGATVAALTAQGIDITYLSVTDDAAGLRGKDANLTYGERVALRRNEQRRAAEILGVTSVEELAFPDAGDWSVHEARQKMVDAIRRIKPDLVVTCDPWLSYEAHGDHRRTGLAAAEAVLLCKFDAVGSTPVPQDMREPMIGFFFTDYPNTFIDSEVYRGRKFAAVGAHESQFSPSELEELMEFDLIQGKKLGAVYGAAWVEGLKLLPVERLHIMPGTRYL